MTIFDIDGAVEQLAARRNKHLPTPTRGRYMPLRAGVLNTWEYDDQQFWFKDGRLHLRGRNEAGKSKVLELVFPFVLDGDINPKKLDPFDTVSKSMWWNLIGFHPTRKVAIGYVWIEFGRLDETGAAEYLTTIVGMQATRADRTPSTWFGLTSQRVDVDIDLAPGDIPLDQVDFEAALSTDAQFETKATNHRANVGARLFAMGPERFNNLLHLLRQLRKPKLADKLDRTKLSDILTKALPPLDERRIEPLAKGFGLLDADIEALRQTERSYRATTVFLEAYRSYARSQVRQRAGLVTATNTAFDNVTREESVASRAVEEAQKTSANLLGEATALARRYADASGSLAGLDLSAVESLRSLEAKATADDKIANGAEGEAARARSAATRAARTAADSRAEAETAGTHLDAALAAARRGAGRASIDPGWEHDNSHQVASAAKLALAVRQRRVLVEAVAEAERRAAAAREQLAGAEAKLAESQERREVTAEAAEAAVSEADAAQEAFADSLVAWMVAAPSHRPDLDVEEITDSLSEELAGGDGVARPVGTTLAAAAVESAEAAVHDRTVDQANAVTIHIAARSALAAHDALPADPPPPARPGVAESRVGVPLWRAVEFADNLAPDEAAMLEAALDAAGLLDAIITESGLVDLRADDTLLVADPGGTGISHWLRPVTEAPMDEHLVAAALASVGAGPGTASGCWVDLDGSWANGLLTGRWSKPAADYIGAAARATASARRRVGLVSDLERAEAAVATTSADLEKARGGLRRALEWRDAFPSIAGWATAERDVRRTAAEAAQAEAAHRAAIRAHDKVRQAGAAALTNLELAVSAASCRPNDVAAARTALDDAAEAARELSSCVHDHATTTGRCTRDTDEAKRLAGEADTADARLEAERLVAAESSAAYRIAVEVQGADVAQILTRKDQLEREVLGVRTRQTAVDREKSAAREDEIRAEAVLADAGRRRELAKTGRDDALTALAAVVRTGHVALTMAVDAGRDPSDYLQPTAGRNLARQITNTVGEDEASETASSRNTDRLVREYSTLTDAIGSDFDPHLDTAETVFVATATLNGEIIGVAELHQRLAEDVEERRKAIAARERTLIEQHLRDHVGVHLGECLHAARTQVTQMNTVLRQHPTNSRAIVQLQWKPDEGGGASVREAVQALLTSPDTREEQASAKLATFLTERVDRARRGDMDGADLAERLMAALDYRTWHTFSYSYKTADADGDLTARRVGAGSGGHQAKIAHLPLLAAAAAFYSTSPSAPRLCFLDEAFTGIDGPNTADLLATSVELDLDLVMTNFDAWFCIPEVPGLAIYHLEKQPDAMGVAAIRYVWDGHIRQEEDRWFEG